ncbi:MAG: cytochrome c [Deltaproteobacteria bacterium]|nr:cytochrome c [Deltaproteobacteria bacterium]
MRLHKETDMRRWMIIPVLTALLSVPTLAGAIEDKPKAPPAGASTATHRLYGRKCASCHGLDGKGDTKRGIRTKANDWTKPGFLTQFTDEKLIELTTKGVKKMPGYGEKLSSEEIVALVQYMRLLVPDPAPAK